MLSMAPSTVSRALQDHPDISSETKARVKEIAKRFNYIPNLHARFFRKKHSGLIALIIPQFNMFFTPSLMDGIKSIVDDKDYSLIVFQSNNSIEVERQLVDYCLSWVVDGVLMVLSDETNDIDHLTSFLQSDIPVVILDKVIETPHFSTVTIDDDQAAYEATKYLVDHGRKNLLGVFANPVQSITQNRILGFKKALLDHHMSCDEENVFTSLDITTFPSEFKVFLNQKSYDGIFIMSDELLVHAYAVLQSEAFSIPKEVAVIALSDGKAPHHLYPYVTHIHHSGYDIGVEAGKILLSYIDRKSYIIQHYKLPTNLVELMSV